MADRPILFSAPMVRAILREIEKPGTGKTQTRRACKWTPSFPPDGPPISNEQIEKGDRLWVREEHFQFGHWEIEPGKLTKGGREKWRFVPDRPEVVLVPPAECRNGRHANDPATPAWHKRLGRFMFRKHSRISLYVTDVRVERLQDIRINDALAEGVQLIPYEAAPDPGRISACWYGVPREEGGFSFEANHPAYSYGQLWDAINGAGAWEANPWVVAYTFSPRLANIDSLPATLGEAA